MTYILKAKVNQAILWTLCNRGFFGGYDAEILTVRELSEENDTFSLEVIAENTGTMSWSEEDTIRMTLWTGDLDMGIRASTKPGVVVQPGEHIN